MVAKDYNKTKGSSSKPEVGEIDTSSPFQSVKDAVSLFGEGAFSGEKTSIKKTKPQSAERVLAKETRLHMVEKELNKLKERLKNAEETKAQALSELDRARKTVDDLSQKLKAVNESKDLAIKDAEMAKNQANKFAETKDSMANKESSNADQETMRNQYMDAILELDAAKNELIKLRQGYNEAMEAKDAAIKQEAEAENAAKTNMVRIDELSKEITSVHDSVQQVKLEASKAKEYETKTCADKDKQKHLYKARVEESVNNLLSLKKDLDPKLVESLDAQLAKTLSEVDSLKSEIERKRADDENSVKTVTSELDGAKGSLHKVAEEESSLRAMVETLKQELENVRKEHSALKENEAETESTAGNLHVKLRKANSELEEALAKEAKARGASDEAIEAIHQLSMESENSKNEAEKMTQQAEELKREAIATKIELEEAEKNLQIALHEAEEAKAAEARALDQIKVLSEKTDATRASHSEQGAQITISRDELESLGRKVEESAKLADMKVEAAMAQAEAVKASEKEALMRLKAIEKEIEEMKAATEEALKKAEMAESAKRAVEGELRKWREREQKWAQGAGSHILAAETDRLNDSSPRIANYHIQEKKQQQQPQARKLEKAKTSVSKKVLLPSLSGVFHKKKTLVDGGGGSRSFLPGEKPVW